MHTIHIKRAYEPASKLDGYRVLVDRLWPRGVSKEELQAAAWEKEVAPSNALRTWFHHEVTKWEEFEKRYVAELKVNPAVDELLASLQKHTTITLLYAAHDEVHNNAVVLRSFLQKKLH
ncbi:uncharacterized protein YeaO (DUF488 family) [Chitinophaga skermanii]|uniref:Uncharacterized protein YeaO (DUF488 family) n=1 Tax=Chitinophaga skermanii TaxID=331697 RepID=A0A327QXC9_9BACT|nr:DUF488 domain-containing protein [Chitinophaga skermanii]RAJ08615.1 uncharacterized protein YeaO (DUF488 family) [Chitinophaga skermanii]